MMATLRKGSIKGNLGYFLLLSVCLLIITFGSMFRSFVSEQELQRRFMIHVNGTNTIIITLGNMETTLADYRRDWDVRYHETYMKECGDLASLLDVYDAGSVEAANQMRRLSSFNDYQRDLLDATVDPGSLYQVTSYILMALSAHLADMHRYSQKDMAETYGIYADRERRLQRRLLVLGMFLAASCVLIVLLFSRFIVSLERTIDDINDNLAHLSKHEWDVKDLSGHVYEEFVDLFGAVNRMKRELHEYVDKIQEQSVVERQLAEEKLVNEQQHAALISSQMQALQAQVNPHALFNSLHMIGMALLIKPPQEVLRMLEATGGILRYSLYTKEKFVNLSDELAVVKQYVFLQKASHDEPMQIIMDVKETDGMIIPMCIQPIVENCFKHGLAEHLGRKFVVRIAAWREADLLEVVVKDNGVGMESVGQACTYASKGIGLSNIKERMRLQYGRDDLLCVESVLGQYTSVTLRFPQQGGAA